MVAILEGIRSLIFGTSTVEDSEEQNNNPLVVVGDNSTKEKRKNQPTVCDLGAQESNQSAVETIQSNEGVNFGSEVERDLGRGFAVEPTQSNTDIDSVFQVHSGKVTGFCPTWVERELRKAFVNDSSLPKSVVDHNIIKSIIKGILEHEKFKKYIDGELKQICAQSVEQAREVTDKHIKGAVSCAYFTKGDKGLDVLNIHLDEPSVNKPIPISDVLEKEQGAVSELNIYGSSGEREVNAKRNKEIGTRNYNFEEGANYLMTINWLAEISGSLSMLTMVVRVNSSGIIGRSNVTTSNNEVVPANNEQLLKLAAQNKELLINGCSFAEALEPCVSRFRASESFIRLDDLDSSFNSTQNSTMVDDEVNKVDEQNNTLPSEGTKTDPVVDATKVQASEKSAPTSSQSGNSVNTDSVVPNTDVNSTNAEQHIDPKSPSLGG